MVLGGAAHPTRPAGHLGNLAERLRCLGTRQVLRQRLSNQMTFATVSAWSACRWGCPSAGPPLHLRSPGIAGGTRLRPPALLCRGLGLSIIGNVGRLERVAPTR